MFECATRALRRERELAYTACNNDAGGAGIMLVTRKSSLIRIAEAAPAVVDLHVPGVASAMGSSVERLGHPAPV